MTPKQQLLLEIEQAPDAAIEVLLDLLRSLNRLLPTPPEEPESLDSSSNLPIALVMNPLNRSERSFAQALCLIPGVGDDSDFDRIQDQE
ncbi:MAG: hypothetical protein ACO3NK_18455 [Prochlorotrichaceae cyanobacterium]|jgi:hypothetical protein